MQYLFWLVPLIVLLASVLGLLLIRNADKKLRRKIASEFGRVPEHEDFEIDSVNGYHYYTLKDNESQLYIDNITWNDLNMDDVYQRVDNCQTTIGQEYLYHKLHEVCLDESKRADYNSLLEKFNDADKRRQVQLYLAKLGKSKFSISSLVFDPKQHRLKIPSFIFIVLTVLVTLLIAATIVCAILTLKAAGILLILSFLNIAANIVLYFVTKLKLENQLYMLSVFSGALWTCRKIVKSLTSSDISYFAKLDRECKKLKFIKSRTSRRAVSVTSELDYLKEFIYMIFLVDIRKYNKCINGIIKNKDTVRYVYKCLGEIDVSINTLSFMKSLKFCCEPDFCKNNSVEFSQVYHPLLKEPVCNSGVLDGNVIITGANASGKSTFIKAIAVNNILALSLNVCCAKSYKLKRTLTITSMAQRDDIIKGDSYYIAELKSLKRILDKIDKVPCSCFVDEILKGTNTAERIAASISVLNYLHNKECFCVIATHDTEIAETLEGKFSNYHFEEKVNDNDIEFDYILKQGIAKSKNAIKLLGFFDYPNDIVENANARVKAMRIQRDGIVKLALAFLLIDSFHKIINTSYFFI